MKVLRVHAPGTPPELAAGIGAAVASFNRGLDIRLRFLSIGVEETVIHVADAAEAASGVASALAATGAESVLLLGEGPAALAAATSAVRARATLVRAGAGERGGACADEARAVDRIAAVHLVSGPDAVAALAGEGLAAPQFDVGPAGNAEAGERIVRALSRVRAALQSRTTGGS